MSRVKVAVIGARGKMGATVCEAVTADPELELVAAVNSRAEGDVCGVPISASIDAVAEAGATVVVDFTVIDAARETARWCAERGVHAVIGTSGFSEADYEALRAAFTRSACLVAPNFAIGAVLMMRFAEMASPYFDVAEIVELHHDQKADAPSGTAMETATRMAAVKPQWAADPTQKHVLEGARGGAGPGGIRIHSVRMRGMVAHQEVILGTAGQTLEIRHNSFDRSSFMPGVVLAVKRIGGRTGLTVGLDRLLDL